MTSIRQPLHRHQQRFSWITEWNERFDTDGRPVGIELILPVWFYTGVIGQGLVLTIDRTYFQLTGGIERWLYRLVRKHGGRQTGGWSFDLAHLHLKSGVLSSLKRVSFGMRDIVRRQSLLGYRLSLATEFGRERLSFVAIPEDPFDVAIRRVGLAPRPR